MGNCNKVIKGNQQWNKLQIRITQKKYNIKKMKKKCIGAGLLHCYSHRWIDPAICRSIIPLRLYSKKNIKENQIVKKGMRSNKNSYRKLKVKGEGASYLPFLMIRDGNPFDGNNQQEAGEGEEEKGEGEEGRQEASDGWRGETRSQGEESRGEGWKRMICRRKVERWIADALVSTPATSFITRSR